MVITGKVYGAKRVSLFNFLKYTYQKKINRKHLLHQQFFSSIQAQCNHGCITNWNNKNGFSFSGLFKTFDKKFMGFGVCVSVTKPAA